MFNEIPTSTLARYFPETNNAVGFSNISEKFIKANRKYYFNHGDDQLSLFMQTGRISKVEIRYAEDDQDSPERILFASADQGRVHYSIYTRGSIFKGHGGEFFKEAYHFFEAYVPGIFGVIGEWRYEGETNYETYWNSIGRGEDPEMAVKKTWSYQRAAELKLTKIKHVWGNQPTDKGPIAFFFSR